jgi:outer membrane lipoprotein-sorting protein
MRLLKIFFFFVCSILVSNAQVAGYTAVSNVAEINMAFTVASAKISTIQSDMMQVKHLSMLKDKLISKGKFYFQKENKVRLEYQTPFKYILLINGTKISIKDNDAKTSRFDAGSNPIFKQINSLMIDCVKGSFLENKNFAVTVFENKTNVLFQLTPTEKGLKTYFKNIHIYVAKSDYAVQKIQMTEVGGDYTIITFQNKTTNAAIPATVFTSF